MTHQAERRNPRRSEYEGPERRQYHEIPDAVIDHIAERAAERAAKKVFNQIYQDIGRNVTRKAAWVIGVGVIALAVWLGGKGMIE